MFPKTGLPVFLPALRERIKPIPPGVWLKCLHVKALEAIDALAGPKSQGVGFLGNPGPVSRELDARNSCEHPKLLRGVVRA